MSAQETKMMHRDKEIESCHTMCLYILLEQKQFAPPILELLPPEALCPGAERQLALISQNLRMVRDMLERKNHLKAQEEQWIQVGYILDSLLYRLYLIFIGSYAIIIISVWCVWYNI